MPAEWPLRTVEELASREPYATQIGRNVSPEHVLTRRVSRATRRSFTGGVVDHVAPRISDSWRTPLRSILKIHFEPRHCSQSGACSTTPVAIRSSRFPAASASSSKAVTIIPAWRCTRSPASSLHVSSCERHRISPKSPLKSARSRITGRLLLGHGRMWRCDLERRDYRSRLHVRRDQDIATSIGQRRLA